MTASEPNAKTPSMRVASYNIRKAVGLDWRRDGERIVRVLAEIDSDIVVLQEADKRLGTRPGVLPAKMLSDDLGYEFADFDSESPSHGWHGNAILFRSSRFSLVSNRKISLPTLEPRGAVSAVFEAPVFEIIGVHLGLTPGTRRKQLRALADHAADVERPVLIAGDFNSALANEQIEGLFENRAAALKPGPSFHASRPFAALDRFVLVNFTGTTNSFVHTSELTRRASDHLPIVIDVDLGQRPTNGAPVP